MQLWLLVEVALLLIGLTKTFFDHPSVIESPLRLRALWPKYILVPPSLLWPDGVHLIQAYCHPTNQTRTNATARCICIYI
jgi:hypothetical protein